MDLWVGFGDALGGGWATLQPSTKGSKLPPSSSLERDFYRRRLTRQKGPEDDVSAQGPENGDHRAREMAAKSGLSARELSVAGFGRLGGGGRQFGKTGLANLQGIF